MDIKPQFITQGHHFGHYQHLMANAMLSGTSRAHTAGLLGRSPSAWLKAPSFFPLLCGPQWLLSAHSVFATNSHSSASWVEQSEGHMEERIGK